MKGDSTIFGLRYSDSMNNNDYSLKVNTRLSFLDRKLRINPRVRIDYRKDKDDDGNRIIVGGQLRTEYRWKKWLHFEIEGGTERIDDEDFDESEISQEYFISAGFRVTFY